MTEIAQPSLRATATAPATAQRRSRTPMTTLAVVVPARNEERRLPRCLTALARAESELRNLCPATAPTRIVVVLDRCTDRSLDLLAQWRHVEVVVSDHGQVGAARSIGVESALRPGRSLRAADWIACTDADSAVPADWLRTHLEHAESGTDLLLGLVRPDPAELSPELLRSWTRAHQLADGHPHIHGANLGIRAEMYARAGGFPLVPAHEDVLLAGRVRELGGLVISTAASPVLTSARLSGRTPAGMAGYLSELAAAAPAAVKGQPLGTSLLELAS